MKLVSNLLKADLKLKIVDGGADFSIQEGDLEIVSEEDNLAQSIIHRLMTGKGELSELGHPDYGSRLNDILGQPNNDETKGRARALVLDCLSQETRIKDILDVKVEANRLDSHKIDIEIFVVPVGSNKPLGVFYSQSLEVI